MGRVKFARFEAFREFELHAEWRFDDGCSASSLYVPVPALIVRYSNF